MYVGVSFLLTTTLSILFICFGVTLEDKYESAAYVVIPIAGTSFVMAIFMKPKRTDVAYKRFLYFHFISFLVVSEVAGACANFGRGSSLVGWFGLFRIPLYC